jgi:diamine N-acetyltransferase
MKRVLLTEVVTASDRAEVAHLRRGPGQERYLNSMTSIFEEAVEDARAMPRMWAVHDAEADTIVGFTMISDNIPEPRDADLVGPYFLWKLLIDESFQRQGYGRATLDAVVGYVRTRQGAEVLFTS